jgi:Xaa-Pro aminopeptidase
MTRTVYLGRPGRKERRIYDTVLHAQKAGVAAVRAGVTGGAVDKAARDVIAAAGFGDRFGHGTGHGVGLKVHEAPRIGTGSEEMLGAGMVITVEPGIYEPGLGGARIEDLLLVAEAGCTVLTSPSKKDWILE